MKVGGNSQAAAKAATQSHTSNQMRANREPKTTVSWRGTNTSTRQRTNKKSPSADFERLLNSSRSKLERQKEINAQITRHSIQQQQQSALARKARPKILKSQRSSQRRDKPSHNGSDDDAPVRSQDADARIAKVQSLLKVETPEAHGSEKPEASVPELKLVSQSSSAAPESNTDDGDYGERITELLRQGLTLTMDC